MTCTCMIQIAKILISAHSWCQQGQVHTIGLKIFAQLMSFIPHKCSIKSGGGLSLVSMSSNLQLGMNLLPARTMSSDHARPAFDIWVVEYVKVIHFHGKYKLVSSCAGLKKICERWKELRCLVVTLQLLNGHPAMRREFSHFVVSLPWHKHILQ